MMEVSDYIIKTTLDDGKVVLLSTFTTSLILLDSLQYDSIFLKHNFDDPDVESLIEMGFLVDDKRKQVERIVSSRERFINQKDGLTQVTLATTTDCNAHCAYCFEKGCSKKTMDDETVERVIDYIAENCKNRKINLSWFGGEPLVDAGRISYITKELEKRGIEICYATITTNGSLLTDDIVKQLIKCKVEQIQITVDALFEEYASVKKYKGLEDPFGTVIRNLDNLVHYPLEIYLRINYNPSTPETADPVMDYLLDRYGEYANVHVYSAALDLPNKIITPTFENYLVRLLKKSVEENEDYIGQHSNITTDKSPKTLLLRKLMLHPAPAACYAQCLNRIVIDPYGDLYSCHRFVGKKHLSVGNVKIGYYDNEVYHAIYGSEIADSKCISCKLLPICQGGCFDRRFSYGSKSNCIITKNVAEELLKLYYLERTKALMQGNKMNY